PRHSHWGLSPADNLAYQAAAYARLWPSGRVARLHGVILPTTEFPFGALAVEEIVGRAPRLPAELDELADALSAIHSLPMPRVTAPLIDQRDPVAATLEMVLAQAAYMAAAGIAIESRRQIEDEIAWARQFAAEARTRPQPRCLVATDTQPGNFVVTAAGRAFLVDLEKSLYGSPAIDLAHATLYPSTGWDPAVNATLEAGEVRRFYRRYLTAAEPGFAAALEPWLAPMRRLTWLRTITIFAKMMAECRAGTWPGLALEPAFRAHALAHIARCHRPETIARARGEWLGTGGLELHR
ncbi:MAG: phosphotransferase, partial [Alphaproteobacteria bacterium]